MNFSTIYPPLTLAKILQNIERQKEREREWPETWNPKPSELVTRVGEPKPMEPK